MRLRCPHCQRALEITSDTPLNDIHCPSCGSSFARDGSESTAPFNAKRRTLGHYELIEQVGQGRFGTVWKARDTTLDRIVALKVPRNEQLQEAEADYFFRDARAAAQVRHPGVVAVHEVGRQGLIPYIASDFVDGCNLGQWTKGRRIVISEAVELIIKVAEALNAAHEAGIVHRDVKPGNIMLNVAGEPYLTDFGLAKRKSGEISITVDGQVLGTPAYMSPEQARGKGLEADRRTDIWSLGVILFELLTGQLPFRGEQPFLLIQIQQDEPPSPRKLNPLVPRDLETVCLKCLEKRCEARYATAGQLALDLRRFLRGDPILARPIGPLAKTWRWCRRNAVVTSLSAVLSIVLLAATAVYYDYSTNKERVTDLQLKNLELEELVAQLRKEYARPAVAEVGNLNASVASLAETNVPLSEAEAKPLHPPLASRAVPEAHPPAVAASEPHNVVTHKPRDVEPLTKPLPIARLVCNDCILVRFDPAGKAWERVPRGGTLSAGDRVISLPAPRAVLALDPGVTLEMLGGSVVELLPSTGDGVFGLRLERGRVVLLPNGQADLRLRLQAGDLQTVIRFEDPASTMALESQSIRVEGADPQAQPSVTAVDLFAAKGKVRIGTPAKELMLIEAPFQGRLTPVVNAAAAAKPIPAWITSDAISQLDKVAAEFISTNLTADRPVVAQLEELTEHRRIEVRHLALRCLAALGGFEAPVAALNQYRTRGYPWSDLVEDLRAAIDRDPETASAVRQALQRQRGETGAKLYRMLCGYTQADLKTGAGQILVDGLDSQDLDVRSLAFWNLRHLTGLTLFYQPEHNEQQRKPHVARWRQRLDSGQL